MHEKIKKHFLKSSLEVFQIIHLVKFNAENKKNI